MVEVAVGKWETDSRPHIQTWSGREIALRLSGAALHLIATWVVLTGLRPESAGIYYQGVVMAIGLSAILRKKYEFFLAPFITGDLQHSVGIPVSKVVYRLGRSLLIRSTVVCCVLLVVTADLDILEPRLQPYLETFLPFVLAIPFVALATMCGVLLRAANCLVLSVIGATLAVNVAVIGAAMIGTAMATDSGATLLLYSWAYFVGSLVSAGLAAWFLRRALRRWEVPGMQTNCAAWPQVHRDVANTAGASIAHSFVLWGPPCLLAIFAPTAEFASFAAAVRSSQVIEFLLPSLTFLKCTETNAIPWLERQCTDRTAFLRALSASTMASTAIVAGLIIAGPTIFRLYGPAYSGQLGLFAVMLGAQWMNGLGRPAHRYLAENWVPEQVRRILEISAIAGLAVCALGLAPFGAMAAAAGLFVAWGLLSSLTTLQVLTQIGKTPYNDVTAGSRSAR
jgi:hypothetical protein